MTPAQHQSAAAALLQAEATGQQTGLLSIAYPDITMDDAYAIQKQVVAGKLAQGEDVIGWKIGLTSRAMQQALNIDIPDSGVLTSSMRFDTGDTVPAGRFIQPRVEAEIAFVMKSPLGGAEVTRADVLAATDYVAPSLEILDTRILRADPATGAARKVFDTIADNAANAGIVLGAERHAPDSDLRWVGAIVTVNGTVEETGLGAEGVERSGGKRGLAGAAHGAVRADHRGGSGDPVGQLYPPHRVPAGHADRGGFRRLWTG